MCPYFGCLAGKSVWPSHIIHSKTCRFACHFHIHSQTNGQIPYFDALGEAKRDRHSFSANDRTQKAGIFKCHGTLNFGQNVDDPGIPRCHIRTRSFQSVNRNHRLDASNLVPHQDLISRSSPNSWFAQNFWFKKWRSGTTRLISTTQQLYIASHKISCFTLHIILIKCHELATSRCSKLHRSSRLQQQIALVWGRTWLFRNCNNR